MKVYLEITSTANSPNGSIDIGVEQLSKESRKGMMGGIVVAVEGMGANTPLHQVGNGHRRRCGWGWSTVTAIATATITIVIVIVIVVVIIVIGLRIVEFSEFGEEWGRWCSAGICIHGEWKMEGVGRKRNEWMNEDKCLAFKTLVNYAHCNILKSPTN